MFLILFLLSMFALSFYQAHKGKVKEAKETFDMAMGYTVFIETLYIIFEWFAFHRGS
jgi:hypothetical protein